MFMTGYVILFQLLLTLESYEGKRILLLPFSFFSHARQMSAIGEGLAEEGHEVYMVLAESFPAKDHFSKGKIKMITSKAAERDMFMWTKEETSNYIATMMVDSNIVKTWRRNYQEREAMCTNPLSDKQLHAKLRDLKFDLALVDIFPMSRCLLVIPYNLGIPYVGLTTCQEPWVWQNLAPPTAYPYNCLGLVHSDKMSFSERINNLWAFFDWVAFPDVELLSDRYISKFIEGKEVTLNKMASRSLLFLLENDPLLDYPRPMMPNEIQIGGLTTEQTDPLPGDVQTFLDEQKNGVLLMTFGSLRFDLPSNLLKVFVEAFRKTELTVVWKYDTGVPDLPSNVKMFKWLPQRDVLGHPNVKIFLTHCGNNGQMEALYNGVPMIGFPIFGDQPYNCKRLDAHKFGICLKPESLTAQDIVNAIEQIMNDGAYKSNILHASNLFKARPLSPMKTAVYWINHVMKYGGEHLHAHALDMPWYELLMLDILFFVVAVMSITLFVASCTAYKVYFIIRGRKHNWKQ